MEEWERQERRWKATIRIVGVLAGASIMFLLLMFVARHSGGKAQDQFSIICERQLKDSSRGRAR